ncbi:MAG: DUF4932 domain-containing protein [Phycisphaerales bacterium]|nr:MAG: DUF4932 domain-containing protein [Phycisphaerales bacterium]
MILRSALSILILMICGAAEAAAPVPSAVIVEVDPRIELLAAVQCLSDYDEWTGLLTRKEFSYKNQMKEHFEPYKDHPVVKLFGEMAHAGFAFDAPVAAILHHGPPPELAQTVECDDELARRAGGRERLEKFFEELRDFAVQSSFVEFYEAHQPFYDAVNKAALSKLEGVDISVLEEYYGVKQHSYHIIPAPLFHSGGFGPRIRHDDGRFDVHAVCGPRAAEDDLPVFGTPESFRHLVWHEFGHSFVNPVVDEFGEEVDERARLMAPIQEAMARQAYPDWRTCVYEHVNRAVTCRIAGLVQGEEAAAKAFQYEKSRSFIYVEPLAERLKQYEQQREKYPTFSDFFPEVLAVFDEALEDLPEDMATAPKVVRTVPETGGRSVDPSLTELVAEFDRDMKPGGYAWVQRSKEEYPETTGKPFWRSPRVCVLPVKLVPDHDYWIGLNAGGFDGFLSTDGVAAAEYILQFRTASSPEAAEEAAVAPKIIRTVPETGATDVDPNITELIAEFDRDMSPGGYSWTQRSSEEFPETTGMPFWRTPRICVLPVKLQPGHTYWLGLNVAPFQSFAGKDGTTAEEFILQFTTRD